MSSDYGLAIERKNRGYGPTHYGKYRGVVTQNNDPRNMGRVKARCPAVLGPSGETDWALPNMMPGLRAVPAVGTYVWIEFEGGDPNKPIWTGMFFLEGKYTPNGIQLPVGVKIETMDLSVKLQQLENRIIALENENTSLKSRVSSLESNSHSH